MKKTGQLSYILRALLITIAVVIVLFVANPFQEATETGLQRQYAELDMQRMLSPFITLQGQGMAQVQVDLRLSFNRIELVDTGSYTAELRVDADFLESTKTIDLPPMFNYDEEDISGSTLCVNKRGVEFSISNDCAHMPPCGSGGTGQVCSVIAGSTTRIERTGYVCRNGTYVQEDFWEKLYTIDGPGCSYIIDPEFFQLERIVAPDDIIRHQTQPGSPTGAVTWSVLRPMAAFTYRCREEDHPFAYDPYSVEIQLREGNASAGYPVIERQTFECDTEAQHKRFLPEQRISPGVLADWYEATKGSSRGPHINLTFNFSRYRSDTTPAWAFYFDIDKRIPIREESSGTPEQVPRG